MTELSTRDRIVYRAAQSLRQRGFVGTGLRGLVADAGAPWGSLHHYFPGGKDQLVAEALVWSGEFAGARVRRYLAEARTPTAYGMFADLVDTWAADLERTGFELGCPVVGAVADGLVPDGPVHRSCQQSLESWRTPLLEGLVATGSPRRAARDLATTLLASAEGAILMARVTRSVEPLRAIQRALRPLLEGAEKP